MATAPVIDTRGYQELRRRGARADPGPQPRVDELQPQRPRRHAGRAVRVPDRERCSTARTRSPSATAASSSRCSACRCAGRVVGARASSRSPTSAARSRRVTRRRRARGARRPGAVPHRARARRPAGRGPRVRQAAARRTPPPTCVELLPRSCTRRTAASAPPLDDVQLYETGAARARSARPARRCRQTADSSLWIALLLRAGDPPTEQSLRRRARAARRPHAEPRHRAGARRPARAASAPARSRRTHEARLDYQLPQTPPDGVLPHGPGAARRALPLARRRAPTANVLAEPGDRADHAARRPGGARAVGRTSTRSRPAPATSRRRSRTRSSSRGSSPGCASRRRRARRRRCCGPGSTRRRCRSARRSPARCCRPAPASPTRPSRLAHAPVVPGTVRIEVTPPAARRSSGSAIDDLLARRPEVPVRDPRQPAGHAGAAGRATRTSSPSTPRPGDRALRRRRARPPAARRARAARRLRLRRRPRRQRRRRARSRRRPRCRPASRSPTRCRPGAAPRPRPVAEAEKQAARYLQHRDRLVTAEDFEAIVRRTPGVQTRPRRGAADVQPAARAADARRPGAVTLLVIPRVDALHPAAPRARPAVPRRDLPLPRPAPARHDRGLPARARLRRPLDLGRHRRRGRAQRRGGPRGGPRGAARASSRRSIPTRPTGSRSSRPRSPTT